MRQGALLTVFLVVFIDLVGFGIVIPILPYYAQQYGATGWTLGWLMASYSIMQFFFAPFWGRVSDWAGRRPILLLSILGSSIAMALMATAGSLKWLFIARIFAGIFGANISTAYAYVTDITDESERARGMGMVGAAFGLGFIFGPAIGGVLSRWGFGMPMLAGSLLAFANFFFAFVKLEEPKLPPDVRMGHRFRRFHLESVQEALLDPHTRRASVLFLLLVMAITQMEVTFALFMAARFKFDAEGAGVVLACMGAVMVVVQGGLIGKLVRRFTEIRLIAAGMAAAAIALWVFSSSLLLPVVLAALTVLAFAHGVLHPSLSTLASLGTSGGGEERRGLTMGIFQSSGSLARAVAPPIAGWLFDNMSWRSPYFAGSLFLVVGLTLTLIWWWPLIFGSFRGRQTDLVT